MSIVVDVYTETYQTRSPDPEDKWDRGDTRGHVSSVRARYSMDQRDPVRWRSESVEVDALPGSVVYAVVADYETGDTFDRRGGWYQILGVFSSAEEAYDLASVARSTTVFSFEWNDKDYYADWLGYFEHLQDIRVWDVVVES